MILPSSRLYVVSVAVVAGTGLGQLALERQDRPTLAVDHGVMLGRERQDPVRTGQRGSVEHELVDDRLLLQRSVAACSAPGARPKTAGRRSVPSATHGRADGGSCCEKFGVVRTGVEYAPRSVSCVSAVASSVKASPVSTLISVARPTGRRSAAAESTAAVVSVTLLQSTGTPFECVALIATTLGRVVRRHFEHFEVAFRQTVQRAVLD